MGLHARCFEILDQRGLLERFLERAISTRSASPLRWNRSTGVGIAEHECSATVEVAEGTRTERVHRCHGSSLRRPGLLFILPESPVRFVGHDGDLHSVSQFQGRERPRHVSLDR